MKHDEAHHHSFYSRQLEAIKDFDRRYPDHHQPLVTGKRPEFLPKPEPLAVIQAKGSKPAPAPVPSPIPPTHQTPPATSATRVHSPPPVAGPSTSRPTPPPKSVLAPGATDDEAPQPPAKSLQVPAKQKKGRTKAPAAKRKGKGKEIEGEPVPVPEGKGKGKAKEKQLKPVGDMEVYEVPAPAPNVKGKGKEVIPVPDSEVEEVAVPAPARREKGKGKEVVPVPVTESEVEVVLAPAPIDKGKGKEKVVDGDDSDGEYGGDLAPAKDKSRQGPAPAYQAPKVRQPPKSTGRRKEPPCQRCEKNNKVCYAQAGFTQACLRCATLKMRCDPVEKDSKGPGSTPVVPAKRPAPEANAGPSKKKKPAPEPSQPVASGSKAKKGKSREIIETSDAETEVDSGKFYLPFIFKTIVFFFNNLVARITWLEEQVATLLEYRKNTSDGIKSCTDLILFLKDKMVELEVTIKRQEEEMKRMDRRLVNAGRILEELMDIVMDSSDEESK